MRAPSSPPERRRWGRRGRRGRRGARGGGGRAGHMVGGVRGRRLGHGRGRHARLSVCARPFAVSHSAQLVATHERLATCVTFVRHLRRNALPHV